LSNADLHTSPRPRRRLVIASLSVALALVAAACGASAPTPIYIVVTPAPTPTPVVTPTPAPTPTPEATPTPEPTAGLTATPTAAATATPAASPTGAASAAPTSAAAQCSGNVSNQPFWVGAANGEPFPVYCGVVPASWGFYGANSLFKPGYLVTATYKTKTGTARVDIQEGKVGSSFCASTTGTIGAANFGPISGTLHTTSTGFALCASSGGYSFEANGTGTAMTQAAFTSVVGSMRLVPRS